MRVIDYPTLLILLAAGFHLGLVGFFDLDLLARYLPDHIILAYKVVGVSAVWQLLRQRLI
jgi:uncharacterized membrane protein YuzA (DUF378 family)